MKVITDTLKGLVSRRLWPLAVLLVAALVAVPFLLSRAAEPVASAPVPSATAGDGSTETLVALDGATDAERRRVLGTAKDPFRPAPTPKKKKKSAKTAKTAKAGADKSTVTTGGTPAGAGTAPTGGSGAAPGSSSPSGSSKPGVVRNSLTVRFGIADADSLSSEILSPLEALPSQDEPIAIYLGLRRDGKTAEFMLGDGVTVDGDATCYPSASRCDTVRLKAGETAFLTVSGSSTLADGEYQLDLVRIKK